MSGLRWRMPPPATTMSRAGKAHGCDDEDDGGAQRHAAIRTAVPKSGNLVIGQTANILLYLGARHGLAPKAEAGRLWVHQLQLTVADFVLEIHDTHHPLGPSLYYEEQRQPARKRTQEFWKARVPKYLGYFERLVQAHGGRLRHRAPHELC